jgi:transmembrane sensor
MNAHTTKDEAADWAVRLDSAQLSDDEQRELERWLAASPDHRGALLRARAVWMSLGSQNAARAPAPGEPAGPAQNRTAPAPPRRRRFLLAMQAAAAVLVAASVLVLVHRTVLARGDVYETGVGEVRRIALEDGSAITLNSNSVAVVHFEPHARTVRLKRGEGLFEVAKDKSRPFVVSSGDVSVRAVGTAFAVRELPGEVTVTVTEGVVEVTGQGTAPHRVSVNQRAQIRAQREVTVHAEDPAEASRRLSWREGVLSFSGESLAEAVREVNRYSRRQVEVSDPVLAGKPVIGIFRAGDVDAFAQATAAAFDAEAQTEGEVIRLIPVSGH